MTDHARLLERITKGVSPEVNARISAAIKAQVAKREGKPGGDPVAKEMSEELQAAMTAALRLLAPFTDELTGDDVASFTDALGIAPEDDAAEDMAEGDESEDVLMADDSTPEEMDPKKKVPMSAYKAKDDGDGEDLEDEQDKEEDKMEKSAEEIAKGMPASVRKSMQEFFKSHAKLQADHVGVAKALKIERDHRVLGEYVAKAASYRHIAVPHDKLGALLKEVADHAPKAARDLESILKAVDGQLKATGGVFAEVGSSRSDLETDAKERANAAISDAVAKSAGSAKSAEQIEREFYRTAEGRKLYAEVRKSSLNS